MRDLVEILRVEYPDCTDRRALAQRLQISYSWLRKLARRNGISASKESITSIARRCANLKHARPKTDGIVPGAIKKRSALELAWGPRDE